MNDPLQPYDEFNRALKANVHPQDWKNPVPMDRYNLVVIGGGTAGLVAAAGAAGLGAKVALVERGLMGGDCLNFGCVPSKALLRCGRAAAAMRDGHRFGIHGPERITVDFESVMQRMRRLRAGISHHDSSHRFKQLGVDVFMGTARFTSPETVEVSGSSLRFRKAVIATGGRAAIPPIPGIREAKVLTNETVFSLTILPKRLAVIGAGPIGCELAQAFARFGSKVVLIERNNRILGGDDVDAADTVIRALRRDGVDLRLKTETVAVVRDGMQTTLTVRNNSREEQIVVDETLLAVGRKPNVENLELDAAGVRCDDRQGIVINDRLQTTNPSIYAAGDVCSRFQFTHAADFMARIVIQNALFLGRRKLSGLIIPHATYTSPELAHVGRVVDTSRKNTHEFDTYRVDFSDLDRAVLDGDTDGFVKIHTKRGSDRIVGATIVADHAGDLIGAVSIAMSNRVGLGRVANSIHPYPTQADAFRKAGDLYQRTRLTPLRKRVLDWWLRCRR